MKTTKLLVLLVALVLGSAACGGKSAEEALLEEILESGDSGISDINIDSDGDEFNITFDDEDGGTVNVNASGDEDDFSMVIEGEDGEVMTFGTGDIPDGLKTPVPDGGSVLQTFTSGEDISIVLEYPQDRFDDLVRLYDGAFGGDETSRHESSYTTDDGTIRNVSWAANNGDRVVSVSDCYSISSSKLDGVCVNIYETSS